MFPKVKRVVPTSDYKVYIYFDDGKIKLFDAHWYAGSSPGNLLVPQKFNIVRLKLVLKGEIG